MKLLAHDKIQRVVRKNAKLKQSILFDLWDKYNRNELNSYALVDNIVQDLKCTFPSADCPLNDCCVGDPADRYEMSSIDGI